MNPYEKLDHEESAWKVEKTARFLGYHPKHVYRLIRQGKIEGWMRIDGKIRFCPVKLKQWMEKRFNGNGQPRNPDGGPDKDPGKDPGGKAA